jgi:hypothetical protein
MFPNVRLMIVAVFASIMGISCALGLFAEFRVSHDSFLRESNVSAPLQLGSNGPTSATVVSTAAPFEFRFQANSLPPAGIENAGGTIATEHAAGVEAPQKAPQALPMLASAPEPATPDAPSVTAPEAAPTPASAPERAQWPASAVGAPETAPEAATGSVPGQNAQDAKRDHGGDLAARTPATSAPSQGATPESQVAPANATVPEATKGTRTTLRRRPVALRRLQRSRSAAPAQTVTAAQPAYQWTSQFGGQSPQPVRRRTVVRRIRPTKKPVAKVTTPQATAASNPAVSPNPQ